VKNQPQQVSVTRELGESKAAVNVIATISHEIRTPLHAIMGLAELVKDEIISDTAKRHIEKILVASEALLQTLNTSIDAARVDREGLYIDQSPFDLLPVMENASKMFALNAESKGVSLNLHFDPRLLNSRYLGDPARLLQIISNLLGNAVKFTEAGDISLWVALRRETSRERQIYFAVEDSGIGIPKEYLERITQQYSQVQSAQAGRPKGSGLGLFITKKLIALMGSDLKIESSARGSRFSFTLSLPIDSSQAADPPQLVSGTLVRVISKPSVACELLQTQLKGLGAHVDYSEKLNVEHLRHLPDLTFVDFEVAIDQPELWQSLRVQTPEHKLVLLCSELDTRVPTLQAQYIGWFAPHLPSDLLQYCGSAGLLAGNNSRSHTFEQERVRTRRRKQSMCIFCVDDSPTNLIVLKGALNKLGFSDLQQAVNGVKAVEYVQAGNEIDLIFMDFNMPVMNGAVAAREIRKIHSDIPIIGLTALSDQEIGEHMQEGDFDLVLTKPASAQQIDDAINQVLRNRYSSVTPTEQAQ